MARLCSIGLMSGTSYDGVDVALIDTDGEDQVRVGPTGYRPYSEQERGAVRRAIAAAAHLTDRTERPRPLAEAEELVTDMHAEAVEAFLAANGMPASEVAVVGFHGQTVLHRPDRGLTIQLGNGPALAARLGIPVVYDFRAADVAAGGQGAPVVPIFHRAMVRMLDHTPPIAVLNIGGVANLTFIDGKADLIAFDTGPGNALIDDFLRLRTGQMQDDEGRIAGAGRVDEAAVERVLAHPFFARRPPKSLDRNEFRHWVTEEGRLADKTTEDGAATITAITVEAIVRAIAALPRAPANWIVAGGGTRNPTLMRMLSGAPGAGQARHRARGRLVGRRARGAGLRLPRGARAQGHADHVPDHDRRATAAERRGGRPVAGFTAARRSRPDRWNSSFWQLDDLVDAFADVVHRHLDDRVSLLDCEPGLLGVLIVHVRGLGLPIHLKPELTDLRAPALPDRMRCRLFHFGDHGNGLAALSRRHVIVLLDVRCDGLSTEATAAMRGALRSGYE